MASWQPIRTAPRSGEPIDLWCVRWVKRDPHRENVRKEERRFADCHHDTSWGEDRWVADIPGSRGFFVLDEWVPTHWRPRPGRPERAEIEAELERGA